MTAKQRVAAAIANERGNRRGVPTIVNILDLLPPKLLQEVNEEADAVLETLGYAKLLEALKAIVDSATDGRKIPEWLEERVAFALTAIAKAEGA